MRPASAGGGGEPEPGDEGFAELLDQQHRGWALLRTLPFNFIATRVPTINRQKFLRQPRFAQLLERGLRVASARAKMADDDATSDAGCLTLLITMLLFNKKRPTWPGVTNTSPWYDIVQGRVARLWAGDFEGLIQEARAAIPVSHQHRAESSPEETKARAVNRAIDFGNNGSLSRSLRSLTATGSLPLSERLVQEKFCELLNPNNEERPKAWREFLTDNPQLPGPANPMCKFVLDKSIVAGPEEGGREVDTLEWVLQHLDVTSSPGVSGLGYDLLRHVSASVLKPLLEPYFGQGRWNYDKTVQVAGADHHYQVDVHALMISVLGVALNKDGKPFNPLGPVENLRPIGVGESLRRVAGRCQLLQSEFSVGARLAENGQYGCGFKRGAGTVFHLVSKCLDALTAEDIPCAVSDNDAVNAYCSILRSAMQRGIAKHAPEFLPGFDFLYAHLAYCFFYVPGSAAPVGWCEVNDGVHLYFDGVSFMLRS